MMFFGFVNHPGSFLNWSYQIILKRGMLKPALQVTLYVFEPGIIQENWSYQIIQQSVLPIGIQD